MATIVDFHIRKTGGDSDDLRQAIRDNGKDLVAADEIHRYIIHDDWEDGYDYSATSLYLDFVKYTNSSEDNCILITCPDESRTNGVTNRGSHLTKSGTGYFMATRGNTIKFSGLEISAPFASSGTAFASGDSLDFVDCYVHDTAKGITKKGQNTLFVNCTNLVLSQDSKNCTLVNCGAYSGDMYYRNEDFTNCIAWSTSPRQSYDRFYQVKTALNCALGYFDDNDGRTIVGGVNSQVVQESDFVDFAEGNYSTHPDSLLFTAGVNGEPIGAVLGGVNSSAKFLTIETNVTGADFVILEAGTDNVLESTDQTPETFYKYPYTVAQTIDIGIIKQGYEVYYYYGYTLTGEDATFPINLRYDRNYI